MATLEPQTKTIDGFTFTCSQLPGMRSLKVFTRITKMLGKGASKALGAANGSGKDNAAAGAAVLELLGNVDEADVEYVARQLLEVCVVACPEGSGLPSGNVAQNFDQLFQGRLDLLLKALIFAIQVNFGSFLKGLATSAAAAAKPAPAAPAAPTA